MRERKREGKAQLAPSSALLLLASLALPVSLTYTTPKWPTTNIVVRRHRLDYRLEDTPVIRFFFFFSPNKTKLMSV